MKRVGAPAHASSGEGKHVRRISRRGGGVGDREKHQHEKNFRRPTRKKAAPAKQTENERHDLGSRRITINPLCSALCAPVPQRLHEPQTPSSRGTPGGLRGGLNRTARKIKQQD